MKNKNIEDAYPLTHLQEGLLFHSLYAPEDGVYVTQVTFTMDNVDVPRLSQAWHQVVARHPILRTAFVWKSVKQPLQVVGRQVNLPIVQEDWRSVASSEQDARFQAFLAEDRAQGFNLSRPPLMRVALFQITEISYKFVWSHHHILLDGWSTHALMNEVFALYVAAEQGQTLSLPPSRPYRDYLAWLQRQDEAQAEQYWRETLAGFSAPTTLRMQSQQAGSGDNYASERVQLSRVESDALRDLAKQHQLTVNTLIQGALAILLSRYTSETDIVFGSVVSGRPADLPGIEHMIGLFVNSLPVRVQIWSDKPLLAWLRDLQQQQAEMRNYEYSALVNVQACSDVPRDLPLFEVLYAFENYLVEDASIDVTTDFDIRDYQTQEKVSYPLTIVVGSAAEMSMRVMYDNQQFDGAMIKRLLGHMQTLLQSMLANPTQILADLSLLSAEEYTQVIEDWNQTITAYPDTACVHTLFEAQVAHSPQAIAVQFNGQGLTYQALNEKANQLAQHLHQLGVGPETLVGLCVERSMEMVIGILGILKAGGAYLPLDPTYPPERLTFMLADTQTPVLLTQAHLVPQLPEHNAHRICLDTDWPLIAKESTKNLENLATADSLAYVMYTSGSTGRPKGISITHRNIVRLVKETNYANLGADEVFLQYAPISFDAATLELWGSLLNGALLVVPPPHSLSLEELGQIVREQKVTTLWLTSGLFHLMVDQQLDDLRSVRQLMSGGDVLSVPHVIRTLETLDQGVMINGYGPTENTTFTTCYPMTNVDQVSSTVPIGRPIANTQVYILDQALQPTSIGVPGELYIGGDGLARDYLNRPELTAEKFIPHPFSQKPGARLYKTGDLVRYLPPGDIEFIGRIDHQVKLRGFRIELGEIETALTQHSAVQDAIVMVRDDTANKTSAGTGKRLVGYLVQEASQSVDQVALRAYLQAKLPDYMVPAALVVLDAFPLNPNGKVDRKALPEPEFTLFGEADASAAPRTPTEAMLANIWSSVLGVAQISIHDSFFDLGGHSLMATQLISRLRQTFSVEMPLRDLFEAPTVAGLAQRIEALQQAQQGLQAPPIVPVSRAQNLPLSFGQQRLWFVDQLSPGNSAYNFHVALRLQGSLSVDALTQSLEQIVQRHEALRTTFALVDGQPVQVIHDVLPMQVEVIDLPAGSLAEKEAHAQTLVDEQARIAFDLAQRPLLRFVLLKVTDDDHIALVVMHHIITDGWSLGIFVREFVALYQANLQGQSAALPTLAVQYADFAAWQQQWMQGEVLDAHAAYWQRQLASMPTLALPTDFERPAVQTFRGARTAHTLPAELASAIKQLSQAEGATLFMVLLAAFKILLARYAKQDDIVVGADIANRNRAETENLIGFFVNQLVLRTDLSGNPTFRELLGRVREMTLGAYAHQDFSFEKMVELLQPERDPSRNPLFQVMFILQNTPSSDLELPDLTVSSWNVEQETTAFDITLSIIEDGDQIRVACRYYKDIFMPETITQLLNQLETLLNNVVAQPDARLSGLAHHTETETKEKVVEKAKRKQSKFDKLKKLKPKSVNIAQDKLIKTDHVQPDQTLPLVIQPTVDGVDLLSWAESNRTYVDKELSKYGAALFRGFNIESIERFEAFTRKLAPELMDYSERSSPRSQVQGAVFTSTDHPADQPIVLHNEQSYTLNWMMKLWFYCAQPSLSGGGTPIADSRNIYRRLNPALVEAFAQKQVLYMRNYGVGMGLPWQEAFQTQDKAEAEAHCRAANIDFTWLDDNRLRTQQVRPAIRQHPKTGEMVWFNHALFFHVTSLEAETRDALLAGYDETDLPFNTYYGDGTPFEPEVLAEIRDAFEQETKHFTWQQGDILMVDNMLVAHGRQPFEGPRKVVVAMAEPYQQVNGAAEKQPAADAVLEAVV